MNQSAGEAVHRREAKIIERVELKEKGQVCQVRFRVHFCTHRVIINPENSGLLNSTFRISQFYDAVYGK